MDDQLGLTAAQAAQRLAADGPNELPDQKPRTLFMIAREVLAGITLAMSVLPEEFPVVLTVFLAMGAWRISRAGVLTRRMPAIESIGAATLLAVDKTGTLTENRMQVALLDAAEGACDLRLARVALSDAAMAVLTTALAASERNPFDPMERAIHEATNTWAPPAPLACRRWSSFASSI